MARKKEMTMEELQQHVIDAVANAVPMDPAGIRPDSTFEELWIDSLDVVNIVFELENALKIKIPEDFSISEIDNIGALTAAMNTLMGGRESCLG